MYVPASHNTFLSTSHNHNNTEPLFLPPPPPPAATGTTMTDNCQFNPSIREVDPKDDISPDFKLIAWDIQNWASHRIRMAMTEAGNYCKFFKVVKV
jgi:hypothetical protein